MRQRSEQQRPTQQRAISPPRLLFRQHAVEREEIQRNRKRGHQAQVPQRVRHQEWTEPEARSADHRRGFVPANSQTQQTRAECRQRQLQHECYVVRNYGPERQADRQRQ